LDTKDQESIYVLTKRLQRRMGVSRILDMTVSATGGRKKTHFFVNLSRQGIDPHPRKLPRLPAMPILKLTECNLESFRCVLPIIDIVSGAIRCHRQGCVGLEVGSVARMAESSSKPISQPEGIPRSRYQSSDIPFSELRCYVGGWL
jgi:hypothetical protein